MVEPYYCEKNITIYLGDCRQILPELPGVDLVLTDPPYGVTQNEWDDLEITKECFDLITSPLVFTCQNPASAELICRYRKRFKWSDVWEKTQAVGFLNCKIMPMRQHEDILVFADGKIPYFPQIQKNRSITSDRIPERLEVLTMANSTQTGCVQSLWTKPILVAL